MQTLCMLEAFILRILKKFILIERFNLENLADIKFFSSQNCGCTSLFLLVFRATNKILSLSETVYYNYGECSLKKVNASFFFQAVKNTILEDNLGSTVMVLFKILKLEFCQ